MDAAARQVFVVAAGRSRKERRAGAERSPVDDGKTMIACAS
jgi:hypothetical protein